MLSGGAAGFFDELHSDRLDNRIEAYFRLRIGHVQCGQDLGESLRPQVAIKVLARPPLFHPGQDVRVLWLPVEPAVEAACFRSDWLDK